MSEIGLGTMTMGSSLNEDQSFEILDFAFDHGVRFFDTAEMYPFPTSPENYGVSEAILGKWIETRGVRDQVVISTKVAGNAERTKHIRGGKLDYNYSNLNEAIDKSLNRLRTNSIDLYQTHWPSRQTNYFEERGYKSEGLGSDYSLLQEIETLAVFQKRGSIRGYGLSNETAWGLQKAISHTDSHGIPRPISIQNPYSLLNRGFEIGMAEICHRERCRLLAYSPLCFGLLSGKYSTATRKPRGRLEKVNGFSRYLSEQALAAADEYCSLAKLSGALPAQLAIAFVLSRPFLASCIIGVTSMHQLKINLDATNWELTSAISEEIEQIHIRIPNPIA